MAKTPLGNKVKLLGVVHRKRPALMVSTALQATAILVLAFPADAQPAPNAHPMGGAVVAGSAAIGYGANTTTITQSTQRAAVNWRSFDVGSQQRVDFRQPSATAMTLNRVVGPDPSRIAGRIDANGQVVLVNQSGVTFFKGAQVNTNGLMVTAAGISNQNFMAGKMVFDQPGNPNARIENQGTITIKQAGLAALVAPQVANFGVINARLGHVVLAGAKTATLDMYGDGLLSLDVSNQVTQTPIGKDGKRVTALVTNTGTIVADGGTVQLTARAADGVVQTLVDAGGSIRATTVGNKTGQIALNGVGGSIVVDGQLSAVGAAPGTTGGAVEVVTSGNVTVASTAKINVSGKAGGGVVAVGTTLARAKSGPSVTPKQTAANVSIQRGATVAANATAKGNGGRVTVLASNATQMDGAITAKGGPAGGNGGAVEISGTNLSLGGSSDESAPAGHVGTLLLDPTNLNIVTTSPPGTNIDSEFSGNSLPSNAPDAGTTPSTITAANLAILGATGDVTVQATGTIDVQNNVTVDNGLLLQAGGNLLVDRGVTIDSKANTLELDAGLDFSTGTFDLPGGVSLGLSGSGAAPQLQAVNLTLRAGTSGGINLNDAVLQVSKAFNITTAGGDVTQAAAGTIVAATVISGTAVQGNVALTSSTNAIGTIGGLAVSGPGHSFALTEAANQNLTVTGPLTVPQDVTLTTSGSGTLTISGGISATAVALNSGAAITVDSTGVISGTGSVGVTGSAIALDGTINDGGSTPGTGTVSLMASGIISGNTGTVIAGTLTGSATGGASLNNASNAVANLGSFAVSGGGFVLNDGGRSGNLAVSGPVIANDVSIIGAPTLSVSGSVVATGAPGSILLTSGAGGIALNAGHVVSGTTVDLATAGGGITQSTTGSIVAGTLTSAGVAGPVSLVSPTNVIGTIGPFTATGNLNLFDASPLTVGGLVQATAGNLYLGSSGGSITFAPAAEVQSQAGGTVGLQADAIVNLGTSTATGVVNTGAAGSGGVFELAPNTQGKTVTLGAATGLSLTNLTGITSDILRIGAVTLPGTTSTTAGAVAVSGTFDATGSRTLDLHATTNGGGTGAVTQTAPLVNVGTLTGSAASLVLATNGNSIANIGGFSATGGSFLLNDSGLTGALTVSGALTSDTNDVAIIGAPTLSVTGAIDAVGTALLNIGTGGISLAAASALSGAIVDIATTGTFGENPDAILTAGTLQGGAVSGGTVSLLGTANAVANLGNYVVTNGNFFLLDTQALAVTGTVSVGAGQQIYLQSAAPGGITVDGEVTATMSPTSRVSFQADNFSNAGSIVAGVLELAPNTTTGGTVTLGAIGSGLSLPSLTSIAIPTTGSLVIGAVTPPGGSRATAAGAISVASSFGLGGVAIDLEASGPIIQTAALLTSSLSGSGTSISLLNAGNSIGSLGNLVATSGSLSLADVSPLAINGTVSATGNVFLATANGVTIGAGATVAAGASSLASFETTSFTNNGTVTGGTFEAAPFPGGAIVLGSGGTLPSLTGIGPSKVRIGAVTIPGVGLTTTAGSISVGGNFGTSTIALELDSTGAISEAGGAALTADTLTGTAGATVALGNANAVNTLNDFSVTGGSFTFGDGGVASLAVNGTVSAPDATIDNVATLNVNGTVSASGTAHLGAGSGGVLINAAALVNGGTVDLDSAGGGVTESGGGLVTAGTLISSTGVSGSVSLASANSIGAVGAFAAGGSFDLVDSGVTNLTVSGPLAADNVTISGAPTLTVTGGLAATTKGSLTAATIALDAGAVVTGATLDLSAGSGGIALTGNAALGQTGGLIDVTTSGGGVTEAPTASVTAATLQSTAGIKGAVGLAGTANKIGTIAVFQVNGSPFSLVDTGPLNVAGTLSATDVTIADSGALTISGTGLATAISLTADSISIPGLVNGGTVALFGTVGAVDETGTLIAGTLTGSAATSANLTGGAVISVSGSGTTTVAANQIGTLAGFTTGTGFTLDDSIALTETNILAGGSGVAILDNGALAINGMVTATAVGLTADSISIPGTVSGTAVSLVGTVGAITETGVLNAGTLTGGAVTSASLIGSSPTINQVGTLGGFAATDFTLDDGAALTVTGQLTVGNTATIVDAAGLTVSGTIAPPSGTTAIAVGLTAATIDISGLVSDGGTGTTSLVANTIGETGTLIAGTLSGSVAGAASLTGATATTNQVATVDGFSAGGGFTLDDGIGLAVANTVSGGPSATILDKGALAINGEVIATSVGLTADSISIPGTVRGTAVSLVGTVGSVGETGVLIAGTLTGSAATRASLTGATPIDNQVGTVNGFTARDGFTLDDGEDLVISGLLNGGSSVTVQNRTQFAIDYIQQITGTVTGTAIDLSAWQIIISGLVSDGGSGTVNLTGQINESGTLIAGTLSGNTDLFPASFTGASPSANQIAALGNYTGNFFELNDGRSLSVGGILTGNTIIISDIGALTIGGTINAVQAGSAVGNTNLSADSIAIPGKLSDTTGGITTLTATTGAISETGTLIAGTLTGSAATSASLTGATTTTNHIGLVNDFTANSGFALNDGVALTVGDVSGGTNATILDKGALAINGMVTATSVGLTADSITIPGNVTGSTVTLTGTVGAINETGTLVAGTLTGSAATTATLTGASATTNQIGTLNGFTTGNGFTLNDGTALTVASTLAGGPSAIILDNGALAINGAVTAGAVGLTASSITVSGNVGGNSAALDATNGAITINGGVSAAAIGLTADGIVVSGNVSGNSAFLNATNGAITINGVVNGTTANLNGTSITIPGVLNGNSVTATATAGAINETGALNIGTLTGAATGSASFTGTNNIASFGPFSSSGLTLIDNSNLGMIGVVNAGTSAAINVGGSLTIAGALIANSIALNATNGISIPGTVQDANSVSLISSGGSISETGALIADTLTGSAPGNVTLTGTGTNNQVAQLGSFTSGGTFTLNDNVDLVLTGPLSAPKIVINDPNDQVTLVNGATITTSGTPRPPSTVNTFPTAATSGFGAFLTISNFTQDGTSTILGDSSIFRIDISGPGNIAFSQNKGLVANNTWLILDVQTGSATGATFVQNLDVIRTGGSGSTQLTGTVGGFSGPAAAGAAAIQPSPNSNFRFNSCPIASLNCALLSALALPTANPLNDINIGSVYNPNDQDDLLLPIVSDQDY